MSDIEQIKNRIKKLMAYANDGAASDGEIENALAHATRLIDAHHLDKTEFTEEDTKREEKMGRAYGKTASPKFHAWETTLAYAVCELFGCVKYYMDSKPIPLRVNGMVQYYTGKYKNQMKMIRQMCFYGPDVEAQEAASLYTEWAQSVATMGVIRWGGAFRGDGEAYCEGFVHSLYTKASELNTARRLTAAKPLAALPGVPSTAITLTQRYDALIERAKTWLEEDVGIKLGKGTSRSGSRSGSSDAYHEGKKHGSAADFGRKSGGPRKQLPGK